MIFRKIILFSIQGFYLANCFSPFLFLKKISLVKFYQRRKKEGKDRKIKYNDKLKK